MTGSDKLGMASQMNTKIRLVRCPKCHLVLPELPEIPVYKCGGCNTVLEAKNQKSNTKETGINEDGPKKADHVPSYSHLKKDTEISDDSDNINMKQPKDAVGNKNNSTSSQDTGQVGNLVLGDENTAWDHGKRVSDDSMELTIEIDVTSLDEDRYDTDRCTEADEFVSDTAIRGHSKDSSFFNDVPFVLTDSSPESGLNNKLRGKSVHLSRKHHAGSNYAFNEPQVQSVRGKAKREADELFKVWTFKGLREQESDSLSNLPTAKPRFEQGATRAEFSKSVTRSCYCCNGSFSCNDGMGDQGPSQTSKPPRRMCCNDSGALNSLSSKIDMHCNGYNRPSVYDPVSPFQEANHNMKYMEHDQTRHYGLCRTRPQNEDYGPRHNFPLHNYGLCSPNTPFYSGPDKLELLKMINELKDELKRTQISNIGFPSRISGEQMHTDFLHSSNHQGNYMSHEPRVSRMPCLGHHGTTTVQCCNEAQCLNHHNSHAFYKGSTSSSPTHQLYTEGHQFLRRDQYSSSNRYVRPTAGGTPFITCYHCSELLQFPADFLVFGRKCHKLRCNACRRTMKFSIQGKGHLVPCITDTVAPPPSMVDDYSDSRSDSRDTRRKNSVDTIELTGKTNGKELSPKSEAALHRLMGYSSLSQVIKPYRKAVE